MSRQRISRDTTRKQFGDAGDEFSSHHDSSFYRRTADVGQHEHVWKIEIAIINLGLIAEHVEARDKNMSVAECADEIVVSHQIASADVDHKGRAFHQLQTATIQKILGLLIQRRG